MCKLYSVPPIPTTLRHFNHLCYVWPIVFDVMMEENHAFKHRGRGPHGFKEGKEEVTFAKKKKKKWKRYYVLGLSKPRAGNCVKLGLEVTEKVIL